MDLLAVVEVTTATTLLNGDRAQANEHAFLDWTVNGQLLRSMLGWEKPPSDTTCMVTGWDLGRVSLPCRGFSGRVRSRESDAGVDR